MKQFKFGTFALLSALCLSRKDFFARKFFFIFFLIAMFFSGGLIPVFKLVALDLNLFDSLLALIIPSAVSVWNIILAKTYFQTSLLLDLGAEHEIYQTSIMFADVATAKYKIEISTNGSDYSTLFSDDGTTKKSLFVNEGYGKAGGNAMKEKANTDKIAFASELNLKAREAMKDNLKEAMKVFFGVSKN